MADDGDTEKAADDEALRLPAELEEEVHLVPVSAEPAAPSTSPDALSLRQEFDSLLGAAERLQENCDRLQGRIELLNMAGIVLVSALLLVCVYLGFKLGWGVGGPCVIVALLIFGSYQRLSQLSAKRRLERDRRALDALARLLRETETAFLFQGVMGTLEIAQFKIRMARFDIRSKE